MTDELRKACDDMFNRLEKKVVPTFINSHDWEDYISFDYYVKTECGDKCEYVTCKGLNKTWRIECRNSKREQQDAIKNIRTRFMALMESYKYKNSIMVIPCEEDDVELVKICPEFHKVNKKLTSLGLAPINKEKWVVEHVAGKRSSIFSSSATYKCSDSKRCQAMLDWLKGIRKVTLIKYEKLEDLSDRARGILYETEWYGSINHIISITTSRGSKSF